MTVDVTFWYGFIVALVVLGGLLAWMATTRRLPDTRRDGYMARPELEQRISELAATIKVLQDDHVRDVQRIGQLERELVEAKQRIKFLEGRLQHYEGSGSVADPADPNMFIDFPLLLILGPDETIAKAEIAAIEQTRMPYKVLQRATRLDVEEELGRRREANELYRFVHVATHAGPQGMELADGIAPREWWNEQLSGVEGVFLAGCSDVKVADWLAGLVDWVVSTYEDVRNDMAARFTRVFYSALVDGGQRVSPREAYRAAVRAVPQFGRCTDFRERKRTGR